MKKWCALTIVLLFVVGQVWSQTTISGKVVSVESGNPVDGANIRVDHSLAGCSTNAKGEFILRNLPEGTHELRVTHVSYGKERGKPGRCAIGKQLHQYRSGCSHRNGNTPADERQPGAGIGYYGSGYPGSQPLDHGRSID